MSQRFPCGPSPRRTGATWLVPAALLAALALVGGCKKGADLSNPKAAAKSFFQAVVDGDADAARRAATGDEERMKTVDALAKLGTASQKLEKAAKSKFGDDKNLAGMSEGPTKMLQSVDKATEKITGDTATLTIPNAPEPLGLKKVGGDWKVDLNAEQMVAPQAKAMLESMAKAMNEVTADIDAGKIKDAKALEAELQAKMMAAALGGLGH